jgi:IS30 family transposase
MPRLSNNDRNQALCMLRAGISTREVARLFNCHQSTVVRLKQGFKPRTMCPIVLGQDIQE